MEPFRAIWVDEGKDADESLLRAHTITAPAFSVRDPRIDRRYLENVRDRGFVPGLWIVRSHYPALDPVRFATFVSQELERVMGGDSPPDFPFVCVDYEPTDAIGMLNFAARYRRHRPHRVTDLTLEGHQGGRFSVTQLASLAARFRYLVPQSYDRSMRGWDPYFMVRDLVEHGAPLEKIRPFYDAARVNDLQWWDGYAFTQNYLPAVRP